MGPGKRVRIAYLGEAPLPSQPSLCGRGRFGGGHVAAGDQRDDLLHRKRLSHFQLGGDHVADLELFVDSRYVAVAGSPSRQTVFLAARATGISDCVVCRQQHRILGQHTLVQGPQVGAGQLPVALHTGIGDVAVQRRADLDPSRPVLGDDGRLQGGDVGLVHRDEPMLGHRGGAPGRVAEAQLPGQHRTAKVECLAVGQQRNGIDVEPLSALDAERQRKPVGKVHQAFVLGLGAGDHVVETVVQARDVGARVVDLTRLGFGRSAPGREVAVPTVHNASRSFSSWGS